MELFSEVYGVYFQVVKALMEQSRSIAKPELLELIQRNCFAESALYLLPKLSEGGWGFFEKQDGMLRARLSGQFDVPLTQLQKAYLKAMLLDEKIRLFLNDRELSEIDAALGEVQPLFLPEDFYYYDRFSDRDDYLDPEYRKNFGLILAAISERRYLNISYESRKGRRLRYFVLPCRLEYSVKNDCFRLLAVGPRFSETQRKATLNVSRIRAVLPTQRTEDKTPDLRKYWKGSCCEPVCVIIEDRRNALERAMLQFANYEKSTRRRSDGRYECRIYYHKEVETELLIEILSFGPMLEVTGSEVFLELLRERVKRQAQLCRF